MEGGVEVGMKGEDGERMVGERVEGGGKVLVKNENGDGGREMEKVSSGGGIRMKGMKWVEEEGFRWGVMEGMKGRL